ncbi:type I-C CRISPR-associated protein Cas7/Csd2 [Rhodococcus xishaensis]|uniref:Type I-C CRISPR-associated protein Cas7/Csd2 n=1 Tax=Rhodococcus xishaensis TaxID=2487364 RepID=A0A438ATS7_9NOCA|nr:type I-C CRISPR-associated protein Cas7/Csd2 [Rhodococcus xishaensis]RVW01992.1 type I-C CRISPR-associated protein Cas7/Csd2 [Rhodococcus xishaensis]
MTAHLDPSVRHDVVLLFDVTDGNPNGDPDAGNQPRTDDETGHGLITDVAMKRKIRDIVPEIKSGDPRYGIFVEAGHALNTRIEEALTATEGIDDAQRWLCDHYFDVRMFGAVLSTGKAGGAGQVRGPLQLTFARSLDPVLPSDHTITRVTQTRQEDIDKGERTEMGSKWTLPYGLYQAHAYYSGSRGTKTGITDQDLQTLWTALLNMFDHDRSATRGDMKMCGLYVFSHQDAFGAASAASLTSRVQLRRTNEEKPPRHHTDYERVIHNDDLPDGVTFTKLVDLWP